MAAEQLRQQVDRVVVLGIGGSNMGAKALMEACCDPYHNQQTREQRQQSPRLYFEGDNLDNDSMRSLLNLLADGNTDSPHHDWAAVVISKSGGTIETAVAFRQFLRVLQQSCRGDLQKWLSESFP